jgi:hypothetical protein
MRTPHNLANSRITNRSGQYPHGLSVHAMQETAAMNNVDN